MKALYKHELSSLFTSFVAYIVTAVMVIFAGVFTSYICLKGHMGQFDYVLGNMSFVYVLIVPVLTMRSFAEERRQKTDQLLYSLPLGSVKIVLAKYFALLTVLLIPTVIIGLFPFVIIQYGMLNLAATYAALLGFFFLGASLIAVGLFISSITENQIIAAIITLGILLLNYLLASISTILVSAAAYVSLIGFVVFALLFGLIVFLVTKSWIAGVITGVVLAGAVGVTYLIKPNSYANLLMIVVRESSLFDRFYDFMYEILKIGDLLIFAGVAVVFIVMSIQSLERRRWGE